MPSDDLLSQAARILGARRSARKTEAARRNAQKAGRPRLVWRYRTESADTTIHASKAGWRVMVYRSITGERSGEVWLLPYSVDFPAGQNLDAAWNEETSFGAALAHSAHTREDARLLKRGVIVR